MVLNRRGVFFTLGVILLVSVLVLLFTGTQQAQQVDTVTVVAETLNNFRVRFETTYVPLLSKQYSYQTLYALSLDAFARPGEVYLSLPSDFESAIKTKSYLGNPPLVRNLSSSFVTITDAFGNLSNMSLQLGYNLSVVVHNITVVQVGAWQAAYSINLSYNLSTLDRTVSFTGDLVQQDVFSLLGIPDLYYNNKQALLGWNDFRNITNNIPERWNNSAFLSFAINRTYDTDNESPSFFNRLQGNVSPSPQGILTLINMSFAPLPLNHTSIDWQFFTGQEYPCTFNVVYPALSLDLIATTNYNLTGTTSRYGICPAP